MVDNENQWEDIEYSDDTVEQDYSYEDDSNEYDEQSEEQDYSEYDNYEDEEDDDEPSAQKKSNPLIMIIVFLLLLGVIGFIAVPKFMGGNQNIANNNENQSVEMAPAGDEMSNSFFDESNGENGEMSSVSFGEDGAVNLENENGEGNETVATVTDAPQQEQNMTDDLFETDIASVNTNEQENNAIMVVYNKAARKNPFKPPVVTRTDIETSEILNNTPFEIIEPPVTSVPDDNLTKLLQTQISGILYDSESPSAIVNLNGLDQFVKIGDVVSGYKIMNITKDKVQISYKNNSYVASVGELFTRGNLEKRPAVANLENKFAGRYKN